MRRVGSVGAPYRSLSLDLTPAFSESLLIAARVFLASFLVPWFEQ